MKAAQMEEKYNEIIKNAEDYLEVNPADLEIRITLVETYFELAQYEKAEVVLEEIRERLDTFPKLHYYSSKIAMFSGNKDLATIEAKKEIECNSDLPFGYIQMGEILRDSEDYAGAEKYYKNAQRLDPNNLDMLKGLAKVRFKRNQMESALEIYKKILDQNRDDPDIYLQLGEVYRSMGRAKLAIEQYKTYLELYPESPIRDNIQSYINSQQ